MSRSRPDPARTPSKERLFLLAEEVRRLAEARRFEQAIEAARAVVFELREAVAAGRADLAPDLAGQLSNLASCLAAAGRPAAAMELAEEAVERWRALGPAYRRDLAMALHNLADDLDAVGFPAEAAERSREALALLRTRAVEPDPDRAAVLADLARHEARAGQVEGAARIAEDARRAAGALPPSRHTARIHGRLGQVWRLLGDEARAAELFAEGARGLARAGVDRGDELLQSLAGSHIVSRLLAGGAPDEDIAAMTRPPPGE